jgi:hypothetical protein
MAMVTTTGWCPDENEDDRWTLVGRVGRHGCDRWTAVGRMRTLIFGSNANIEKL